MNNNKRIPRKNRYPFFFLSCAITKQKIKQKVKSLRPYKEKRQSRKDSAILLGADDGI